MARWKRTCKEFEEVRKMIYNEDIGGIMRALIKICAKYALTEDDYAYEFQSLAEDMDIAYDNGEDPDFDTDDCDYYLSEFYDLCDAAGIWLNM